MANTGCPKKVFLSEKSPNLISRPICKFPFFGKQSIDQIIFPGIANFLTGFEISKFRSFYVRLILKHAARSTDD